MKRFALILAGLMFSMAVFAADSAPAPKMVTCKDGTQSEAGQGACSHHGGVKTSHKMVTCTDGTKSEAGQGACSHHGGMKPETSQKPQTTGAKPAASAGAAEPPEAPNEEEED